MADGGLDAASGSIYADQGLTQTLTGGNWRTFYAGQEFYYQLNVPSGLGELGRVDRAGQQPEQPVHGVPDQSER